MRGGFNFDVHESFRISNHSRLRCSSGFYEEWSRFHFRNFFDGAIFTLDALLYRKRRQFCQRLRVIDRLKNKISRPSMGQSGSYSSSLSWLSLSFESFVLILFLEETTFVGKVSIMGMWLFIVPASHPPRSANKGDANEMRISDISTSGIQGQYTRLLCNMTSTLFNRRDSFHWPKGQKPKEMQPKEWKDYHKVREK